MFEEYKVPSVAQAWSSQRCLFDIEPQLVELIKNDDADNLFSFLYHKLGSSSSDDSASNEIFLSELLVWVCRYRAVNCAALLFGGQVGDVAVDTPLRDGFLPVYHAVQSLSYTITWLFVNFGSGTAVRCTPPGLKVNGLLPLNVAVETLSYYIEWTPKESVFKLVLIFCLPELKEPLETIRLLARYMLPEEVEEVIFQYAEEGKQIELAALLMASWKHLYHLRDYNINGKRVYPRATLRECIAVGISSLIDMECKLLGSKSRKFVQMCEEKKRSMMSVMLLLEIYERVGEFLQKEATNCIVSNPEHVASIFEKMGFPLTNEHVQVSRKEDCFSAVLPWEQLGKLKECRSQPEDGCLPSYMQPCSLPITKMPRTRMPSKQRCRSISTLSLFEIPLCPQVPKLPVLGGFGSYRCSTVGRKTMWSEILRLSPFYLAIMRGRICIMKGH